MKNLKNEIQKLDAGNGNVGYACPKCNMIFLRHDAAEQHLDLDHGC